MEATNKKCTVQIIYLDLVNSRQSECASAAHFFAQPASRKEGRRRVFSPLSDSEEMSPEPLTPPFVVSKA